MPVVANKYRGSVKYFKTYAQLVAAARCHGRITYQDVAAIMGLPKTGSNMGRQVGWLVGEISEDEHLRGRPMLSALVVNNAGWPSYGFFDLAIKLRLLNGNESKQTKREFLEAQQAAIYRTWKD